MIKRPSPEGPLLADSLRDLLSNHAIACLERLDVRRDLKQTCTEAALRDALSSRGLPIYESVIEFERRCGGTVWPLQTFGTLDQLGTATAISALESADRTVSSPLSLKFGDELLLPISADYGACNFWMSRCGTLFLCDDCEENPTADSYTTFLEREALKWGHPGDPGIELHWSEMPTMTEADFDWLEEEQEEDEEPPRPYDEDPLAVLDRRLAAVLGLPLCKPATDRWRTVWFDGSRLLFPRFPWRGTVLLARAQNLDELAEVVRAAQDIRPTVLATWHGPHSEPPTPSEPIAARIRAYNRRRDVYGEILFIGASGSLRVHVEEYDESIWTSRLWHERREAWRGRR